MATTLGQITTTKLVIYSRTVYFFGEIRHNKVIFLVVGGVQNMAKEDYREKVEEHRQEIDLHNESGSKVSRVSRHRKKSAKKQSNPMMTILTVVLIFIPLTILGYVWLIYEPSTSAKESASGGEENLVEIQKQNPQTPASINSDEDKKDTDEDQATEKAKVDDEKVEKERLAAEEAKKAEEKLAKARAEKDAAEAKKAEEAQKVAAKKAKELEEKKKAAAKAEQKTHTVSSSDNLYRIALKYYGNGSPAYIEKIKAANNLSSDSITAGQVLVIVP